MAATYLLLLRILHNLAIFYRLSRVLYGKHLVRPIEGKAAKLLMIYLHTARLDLFYGQKLRREFCVVIPYVLL